MDPQYLLKELWMASSTEIESSFPADELAREAAATIASLLRENAALKSEASSQAGASSGVTLTPGMVQRFGAAALDVFADNLQEVSGFKTVDAPGVSDARMFAASLRETADELEAMNRG